MNRKVTGTSLDIAGEMMFRKTEDCFVESQHDSCDSKHYRIEPCLYIETRLWPLAIVACT